MPAGNGAEIVVHDSALEKHFAPVTRLDTSLNRKLVSFQANKDEPFYRWYKYKEGFSAALVAYYLNRCGRVKARTLLDPFAGSGAALFSASDAGLDAAGIELLPVGRHLIEARVSLARFSGADFTRLVLWRDKKPWITHTGQVEFSVLNITRGAYPEETCHLIKKYLSCLRDEKPAVRSVLFMALLCVLESVSYTRKDGQYLRWDWRSGRRQGSKRFDKGAIPGFNDAITEKLASIIFDARHERRGLLDDEQEAQKTGMVSVTGGSCLCKLPGVASGSVDLVITSPPYCNRYDYTRTYALELAMLGVDEDGISALRQEMLSCTVENREKNLLAINSAWAEPLAICGKHPLLHSILDYLEREKAAKNLNNNGIPRMVRGYFYEMACVIHELYRILSSGGKLVMVNDNVRYAGISISCDLILSSIAEKIGFTVDEISVLPVGKGNSSQQMGSHGRAPLRKCVYLWSKAGKLQVS